MKSSRFKSPQPSPNFPTATFPFSFDLQQTSSKIAKTFAEFCTAEKIALLILVLVTVTVVMALQGMASGAAPV